MYGSMPGMPVYRQPQHQPEPQPPHVDEEERRERAIEIRNWTFIGVGVVGALATIACAIHPFQVNHLDAEGRQVPHFSETAVIAEIRGAESMKMIAAFFGLLLSGFPLLYFCWLASIPPEDNGFDDDDPEEEYLDEHEQIAHDASLEMTRVLYQQRIDDIKENAAAENMIRALVDKGIPEPIARMRVNKAIALEEEERNQAQQAIQEQQIAYQREQMATKKAQAEAETAQTNLKAQAAAIRAQKQGVPVPGQQPNGQQPVQGQIPGLQAAPGGAIAPEQMQQAVQPNAQTSQMAHLTSQLVNHPTAAEHAQTLTPTPMPLAPQVPQFPPDALKLLIGFTPDQKPVHYVPANFNNGFIVGVGSSGAGKTTMGRAFAVDLIQAGRVVLFMAFHDDIEALPGAKTLTINNFESDVSINPFALNSLEKKYGGPRSQRKIAVKMIEGLTKLGPRQLAMFSACLDHLFRERGIEDQDMETWGKPAPRPSDVIERIESWIQEIRDTKRLNASLPTDERQPPDLPLYIDNNEDRLQGLRDQLFGLFDHPVFEGERFDHTELLRTSHVIDMSSLGSQELQYMISDIILRSVCQALSARPAIAPNASDRERYNFWLMSDEAKYTMRPDSHDDQTAPLNQFAMDLRKKGGCLCLLSQSFAHFADAVLDQAGARIILSIEEKEIDRILKLTKRFTLDMLEGIQPKGDGYFVTKKGAPIRMWVEPPVDYELPTRRKPLTHV